MVSQDVPPLIQRHLASGHIACTHIFGCVGNDHVHSQFNKKEKMINTAPRAVAAGLPRSCRGYNNRGRLLVPAGCFFFLKPRPARGQNQPRSILVTAGGCRESTAV